MKIFSTKSLAVICLAAIAATVLLNISYGRKLEALFAPIVLARESEVQNLYVGRSGTVTALKSGGIFMDYNRYDSERPLHHLLEYTALLSMSALYLEDPREVLVIGLAGGTVPRYLHHYYPEADITCVDYDGATVDIAHEYFDFREDEKMHSVVEDGRVFLANTSDQYDLIIVDAFDGLNFPFHITTVEFLELAKSRLRSGGVIAANTSGSEEAGNRFLATYRHVFGNADAYRSGSSGNRILMSVKDSDDRTRDELARLMTEHQAERGFAEMDFPTLFGNTYVLADHPEATPLFTDDYAPVNVLIPPFQLSR